MRLNADIISFFNQQSFVIVSTLDSEGKIHCSAKGVVGIDQNKIYLIDLYKGLTFRNLEKNPTITITAVDEQAFVGFSLKGSARIVGRSELDKTIIDKWEECLVDRMSKRVIKNIQKDKGSALHPESRFPKPKYLIEVEVEKITDLTPPDLKTPAI